MSATAAAGHSFGEVTALAAAGVLPTERLVETARTRGTLMNEAGQGKDGAMLAVSATVDDVRALLAAKLPAGTWLARAASESRGHGSGVRAAFT